MASGGRSPSSRSRRDRGRHLLRAHLDRVAEGRPLRDNLAPFGLEPADYLTLLVFADGGEQQRGALCRVRGVAAVTVPKGRVVYVCGSAFRDMSVPHREHALIHEMLHSLGLGENPPRPREINAAVWRRCGGY